MRERKRRSVLQRATADGDGRLIFPSMICRALLICDGLRFDLRWRFVFLHFWALAVTLLFSRRNVKVLECASDLHCTTRRESHPARYQLVNLRLTGFEHRRSLRQPGRWPIGSSIRRMCTRERRTLLSAGQLLEQHL